MSLLITLSRRHAARCWNLLLLKQTFLNLWGTFIIQYDLYYTIWHILSYLKEIYRNLWGNMLIIMKWFLHFGQSYLKAQAGVLKPFELIIQIWSEDPVGRKIKECCSCDISIFEYFFGKRTNWGTDWCWLPFNWLEASFQSNWYFIITVATNWTFR